MKRFTLKQPWLLSQSCGNASNSHRTPGEGDSEVHLGRATVRVPSPCRVSGRSKNGSQGKGRPGCGHCSPGRRPQNAPQLFCPPSHACLVSVCEQIPLSFLGYLVRLTVHLSSIHKRFGSLCEVSRLPVLRRSLGQCFGSQCEPSALAGPEGASALLHRPASQRTSAQFPGGGRAQAQSRPRRGKVEIGRAHV